MLFNCSLFILKINSYLLAYTCHRGLLNESLLGVDWFEQLQLGQAIDISLWLSPQFAVGLSDSTGQLALLLLGGQQGEGTTLNGIN